MAEADNDNTADARPGSATGPSCPTCGKPAVARFRPFCSGRCKDVDLSRWLKGTYAIPGGNVDEDEDGEDAASEIERRQRPPEPDDPIPS